MEAWVFGSKIVVQYKFNTRTSPENRKLRRAFAGTLERWQPHLPDTHDPMARVTATVVMRRPGPTLASTISGKLALDEEMVLKG